MLNLNRFSKILLSLTIVFGSIWLGGYITRQLVFYQFFDSENLNLLPEFQLLNSNEVLKITQPLLVHNILTYGIFLFSFILFFVFSKINLRQEGWFFICSAIILITSPFEIYLLSIDYKIINLLTQNNFENNLVFNLIKKRIEVLSSFSLIEVFAYIGIIFIAVFKPLNKTK